PGVFERKAVREPLLDAVHGRTALATRGRVSSSLEARRADRAAHYARPRPLRLLGARRRRRVLRGAAFRLLAARAVAASVPAGAGGVVNRRVVGKLVGLSSFGGGLRDDALRVVGRCFSAARL